MCGIVQLERVRGAVVGSVPRFPLENSGLSGSGELEGVGSARMPVVVHGVSYFFADCCRFERFPGIASIGSTFTECCPASGKHLELYLAFSKRLWISLIHF